MKEEIVQMMEGHTMEEAINVLQSMQQAGMICASDYNQIIYNMEKKEILAHHKAAVSLHKDGRWRTYVPTPDGRKKLKVRTDRAKLEDDIVAAYKALQASQAKGKTFDECYWRWREVHDLKVVNNTIAKYDSDYKRYFSNEGFSDRYIMDITEEDVEKFIFFKIDQLKLCREAVKSLLGYIKGTFKSAKKNHDIADDVTKDIQRSEFYGKCTEIQHPVDALLVPEEDWEKLYKRIREDIEKKPYYFPPYAIILSALTGMRVGELSVLRWEDICTDSVSGCTYIGICRSETYDTIDKTYRIRDIKNHRNRVYPISPQIQQLFWEIQQLQEAVGIQTPWIFYDPKHDHINKRQITNCLKNKCNAIGIRPKGTHAFRRQINSDMRCEGVSVVIASSLIGNSEAVNEKHYTFDVSGLEEKEHIVEKMNEKRLQKCKK